MITYFGRDVTNVTQATQPTFNASSSFKGLKECIVSWYYNDGLTMEEVVKLVLVSVGLISKVVGLHRECNQVTKPYTVMAACDRSVGWSCWSPENFLLCLILVPISPTAPVSSKRASPSWTCFELAKSWGSMQGRPLAVSADGVVTEARQQLLGDLLPIVGYTSYKQSTTRLLQSQGGVSK